MILVVITWDFSEMKHGWDELAKQLYEEGRERSEGQSFTGSLLPAWDELPGWYKERFKDEVIRVVTISQNLLLPKEHFEGR